MSFVGGPIADAANDWGQFLVTKTPGRGEG